MLKTFCDINIDVKNESIIGNASYYLENLEQKSKDMTIAINPGYNITSVKINGKSVSFKDTKETENNEKFIKIDLPEDKKLFMDIIYSGKIRQNRILQFKYTLSESNIISDDYISLAGCALIPSPIVHSGGSDGEENTISGHITLPANLKVIAAGSKAVKVSENSQKHLASWSFLGKEKEVVLAGKYECKEIDAGGINVEFYYSPKQKAVIDKIGAVQIIKESMDYFTDKYGKLGYSKDIPLNIVINAGVGGGNAIKNICNISEDTFEKDGFFNPSKIENGLNGNSVETLVHEICHQWWGINVKLPVEIQSSWSPEGITVYSTYKFLQYKYGAKYAYTADVKHWKEGLESLKRNFYYRNPSYMDVIPEKYLFNVLASLNSTRSYSLVPLQIYKAEQIVGEKKFESILAKLFRRYKANLSYDDFLRECGLAKEEISVE
ncbi:hypothetical protein Ccar_09975 [Clostridium carboxidivorans P7]|uniref:Peptidase M1 membrane alanine aminopeptidase domain-containing protein n=2 Tax=Clostridium TaxID=1485 RepID=C6PX22_9CLOT|nr:hypothetical protein [Clostridium carboxidivorans]AKN31158.1 hypothetical protein Ccar_09975 [Clostridium carboxidivorans P7]EET86199.1 conserved hypothetical protein [Clostridium carboxidivorans P7]EFG88266.1 hypothetical protein CLCAR_1840 [Clostridium carboxidivorans P7]